MDSKEHYIGIDYGTSNSCVGVYMKSKVYIAPNKIGERTTPSIVSFVDNNIYIGEDTLNQKIEGNNLIYEVKRFIGLSYEEFIQSDFSKNLNYEVVERDGRPIIKVIIKGKEEFYSPEEISAFIIKKIVRNAEDFINENEKGVKITKAVMTVPCHFSENQKEAIKTAARLADIEVVRIINEPTAAALAYGLGKDLIPLDQKKKKKRNFNTNVGKSTYEAAPSSSEHFKTQEDIIVFDLGGGTFDITILNLRKKDQETVDFEVLGTNGDNHLGGSDFDDKIVDYCIKKFCNKFDKNEIDIRNNKKLCKILKIKCEAAKKLLSASNETYISIDNFFDGEDFFEKITKNDFENFCQDLFKKIENIIKDLLKEVNKNPEDIESVLLIGGATRMSGIKDLIKKIFGERKIKDTLDPDEAVAYGATLQYAKIEEKDKIKFNLQDIVPYNIGIEVMNQNKNELNKGHLMHPLIKRYTKIPTLSDKKSFNITLNEKVRDININIYEGNDKYVKNNKRLGVITKKNVEKLGVIEYTVQFDIDVNSKLTVIVNFDSPEGKIVKTLENNITNAILDRKNRKIKVNKSKSILPLNSVISNIEILKKSIYDSSNINDRIEKLIDVSSGYEQLIKSYLTFQKDNDFISEKIYNYTKELFGIYSERIILNNEKIVDLKIRNRNRIEHVIEKIKEGMNNLISIVGYVADLLDEFYDVRENSKNEFYRILINFMELMKNEGNKRMKNIKFSRYYSKLYFEKAFYCYKKYIRNEDLSTIDRIIKVELEKQYNDNLKKLKEINSFAIIIESLVNEKEFLIGYSGYTVAVEQIEKIKNIEKLSVDELKELLDLFQNMADSYNIGEKSIEQAYCYANIIKIIYKIYKNSNKDKLNKYIEKFEYIMQDREDEKYNWYNEAKEIIKEIENI